MVKIQSRGDSPAGYCLLVTVHVLS